MKQEYYQKLNIIRVIACLAILFYHLNFLKGGYLAVCIFFVLTSYLSTIRAFKQEKFSLKEYYQHLIFKIYIPLIVVVFLTLSLVYFFPRFMWQNLKPETTSILLGFNNYWQLNANLDYFIRTLNSPFIHLWYMAILLQFDLIFPFIYLFLKKLGTKFSKLVPVIFSLIITLIFTLLFYYSSGHNNLMYTYYSTETRIFSCLFGVFLGFLSHYYGKNIAKHLTSNILNNLLFYLLLISLGVLFIVIPSSSNYFAKAMLLTTILTGILIILATQNSEEKSHILTKVFKFLSVISYAVYLIQYPVIYFFQALNFSSYLKIPVIIFLTFALSSLFYFAYSYKTQTKAKILKYGLLIIFGVFSIFGIYNYVVAKDYTADIQKLEQQLEENAKLLAQKQAEYASKMQSENRALQDSLQNLTKGQENLGEVITNLKITGVGDSVMLGAVDNLYKKFPNSYIDAKISRTAWVVNDILKELKAKNLLGDVVILNLGANGDCSADCKAKIMQTLENREVFWLNVTNDDEVHINARLASFAEGYSNLHIIDWESISKDHNEYFVSDGIHLTSKGRTAYTEAIYNALYETYLTKYENEKQNLIANHEIAQKNKITFYGNDLLLNTLDFIEQDYSNDIFNINKEYTFKSLLKDIQANNLTNQIVFAFDKTININYAELLNQVSDSKVYLILTEPENILANDNVTIINFSKEIANHPEYLMYDKIHLSKEGNLALSKIIKDQIKSPE